jgi:multiple sugar transport system substrate-binding protein
MKTSMPRRLAAAAVAMTAAVGVAACGSSGGSGSDGAGGQYTIWDPYPQFDANAAWVKLLQSCGDKAGVKVTRSTPRT